MLYIISFANNLLQIPVLMEITPKTGWCSPTSLTHARIYRHYTVMSQVLLYVAGIDCYVAATAIWGVVVV